VVIRGRRFDIGLPQGYRELMAVER